MGLLDGAFGFIKDPFGSAIKSNQKGMNVPVADVDRGTTDLMLTQRLNAEKSNNDIVQEQMAGVDQTPGLMAAQESNSSAAMGGDQAALGDALRRRSSSNYASSLANIKRSAELAAPEKSFKRLSDTANSASGHYGAMTANADAQTNRANQMRMGRAQVINQVLGAAGNIAGMAIGKPPTGGGAMQTQKMETTSDSSMNGSGMRGMS